MHIFQDPSGIEITSAWYLLFELYISFLQFIAELNVFFKYQQSKMLCFVYSWKSYAELEITTSELTCMINYVPVLYNNKKLKLT